MFHNKLTLAVVAACPLIFSWSASAQTPLGSECTYQGRLIHSGTPVTGQYDMIFKLCTSADGFCLIPPTVTFDSQPGNEPSVDVVDGLFTVELDFGVVPFNGDTRWLEINVRPHDPANASLYGVLNPRQKITATPYALQTRGLFVDDVGNAGIGTSTPAHLLDVDGTAGFAGTVTVADPQGASANLQLDLTGGYEVYRDDTGAGADNTRFWLDAPDEGEVVFGPRAGADFLANMRIRSNAVSFETASGGASALKILNAKVGIGTSNPGGVIGNSRLDVVGGHIAVDNNYGLFSYNSAGTGIGAGIDTESDDDLGLYAGGANRVTVKASGDVGLGTTSPNARLHVETDSASVGDNTARLYAPNVGPYASHIHWGLTGDWYIRSADGSGKIVMQDSGGDVGIGTNSPTAKLTVEEDGGIDPALRVIQDGSGLAIDATQALGNNDCAHFTVEGGTGTAVRAVSDGQGSAGSFTQSSTNNTIMPTVAINTNSTSASHYGLSVIANENGTAASFFCNETTGAGDGVISRVRGSGDAARFTAEGAGHALHAIHTTQSSNAVTLERVADSNANADLLELITGSGSDANMQFIECQRGSDNEFRVWGDGDVTADGVITGGGADFAELIKVTAGANSVQAGDVMVIDINADRAVAKSTQARSSLVAGVYSTKPGLLGCEHDLDQLGREVLGAADDQGEQPVGKPIELARMIDEIPLAVVGIVPCKVSAENGPIRPGDLLVTSATPGHAMRDADPKAGTIVGKALGTLKTGSGTIKILVTLQ